MESYRHLVLVHVVTNLLFMCLFFSDSQQYFDILTIFVLSGRVRFGWTEILISLCMIIRVLIDIEMIIPINHSRKLNYASQLIKNLRKNKDCRRCVIKS